MSDLRDRAIELAAKAIASDNEKKYERALSEYQVAIEAFVLAIKHEKIDVTRALLRQKTEEYLKRAEAIKANLGAKPISAAASDDNSAASVTNKVTSLFSVERPTDIKWEDVVGLEHAKQLIAESVFLPLQLGHLFNSGGFIRPWKGILLFGPPGTGKSFIAKAVAAHANIGFVSVSAADIFTKWVGETEQTIKTLFEQARKHKPACVIFIDEIDSFGRERKGDDSDVQRRTFTQLLNEMDGVRSGNGANTVLVMAATNRPDELDPGLERRFEKRIFIPIPGRRSREQLIRKALKLAKTQCEVKVSDHDIVTLTRETRGYTPAEIGIWTQEASHVLLRRLTDATHFITDSKGRVIPCSPGAEDAVEANWQTLEDKTKIGVPPLTLGIMREALISTKPASKREALERCRMYAQQSGELGTIEEREDDDE